MSNQFDRDLLQSLRRHLDTLEESGSETWTDKDGTVLPIVGTRAELSRRLYDENERAGRAVKAYRLLLDRLVTAYQLPADTPRVEDAVIRALTIRIGDLQTSEAELVSEPLRKAASRYFRRILELEAEVESLKEELAYAQNANEAQPAPRVPLVFPIHSREPLISVRRVRSGSGVTFRRIGFAWQALRPEGDGNFYNWYQITADHELTEVITDAA